MIHDEGIRRLTHSRDRWKRRAFLFRAARDHERLRLDTALVKLREREVATTSLSAERTAAIRARLEHGYYCDYDRERCWEADTDVRDLLAAVDQIAQERDEARGCPHGENCACAIGSRHFWLEAFSRERERAEQEEAALVVLTQRQQWQPIETAPKDGAYVLLVSPAHGRLIGAFVVGDVWHLIGVGAVTSQSERPTHWMPLPDPPQVLAGDGGAETP